MNEETNKESPEMKIVPPEGETAHEKPDQPSEEELREEFQKMLATPLKAEDVDEANKQILVSDLRIAELKRALAALHTQIAATESEIAGCEFAKAIIRRRLANKPE